MGDADKEFQIRIVTAADTRPMEDYNSEMGKLHDRLADKTATSSTISEFQKIEERLKGTGQGVRDVRQIFFELDQILPGSGLLLETAFTGPLGAIVALGFAADRTLSYLTKLEERYMAILSDDLEGPINAAAALAEQYGGIAAAITKANEAFNSPDSLFRRAEEGINAQKGLSESAKLQAELGAKMTEAANANIQARNARQAAEGVHLPSDAEAKKEVETLRKMAKEHQDAADAARKEAAARSDAWTTAGQGPAGLILADVLHPVEVAKSMAGLPGTAGKAAEEQAIADRLNKQAADREVQIRHREALRADAEAKAKTATETSNEAAWESNPNNVGSLAWRQNQQRGFSAGEDQATALLRQATNDLNARGPGAQNAMKDAADALRLAFGIIQQLAAGGDNVAQLRRELESIKAQVSVMNSQTTR